MDQPKTRPTLLRSISKEEFEELARRPDDSIITALKKGEADRELAVAEARPPLIDSNLRFA